jgi:hypothetical protein
MTIIPHLHNEIQIAEVVSEQVLIQSTEDGLDLLGTVYYSGYDRMVIYKTNIIPAFFDLKNGMAGEILQKFSNYRVRLVIVGDFEQKNSNSLNDFIRESNVGKQVNFVATLEEAINRLII